MCTACAVAVKRTSSTARKIRHFEKREQRTIFALTVFNA
jgi:hypothetical protein